MNVAEQRILEKKLDDNTRDAVIDLLVECFIGDGGNEDMLREIAVEGLVGYKNVDDEALVQELHDMLLIDENDPSDAGDVYRKAMTELESYKLLKGLEHV